MRQSSSRDSNQRPEDHLSRPGEEAARLAEFGWVIEPTETGGIRMRTRATRATLRGILLGCSVGMLLFFLLFAWFMWSIRGRMSQGPPDDPFFHVFGTVMTLAIAGTIGLAVVAIVLQLLWLLLVREEWEASKDSLEIRRRLLGVSWGRQHNDGEFLVEANFRKDKAEPYWELAVKSGGRKQYLIRFGAISQFGTAVGWYVLREEVEAIASLLAKHTGWLVQPVQQDADEVAGSSERQELPVELLKRGFRADVDERLRPLIRPPTRWQLVGGLIFIAIGTGWFLVWAEAFRSFVQDAGSVPQAPLDGVFYALILFMLLLGVVADLLGIVMLVGREWWVADRNLLIIRSRLFGWKSERQYMDCVLNLKRVYHRSSSFGSSDSYSRGHSGSYQSWYWHLQLQNQAGDVLKTVFHDRDDDTPRLLGAWLSQQTGFPLHELSSDDSQPTS